jgi:hypothetical protein
MDYVIALTVSIIVFGLLASAMALKARRDARRSNLPDCIQGHGCQCKRAEQSGRSGFQSDDPGNYSDLPTNQCKTS